MGKPGDNLSKSILSVIPLAKQLKDDFIGAIGTMENSAVSLAKQFGQGRENILNIKAALNDATDSLTKVGVSITQAISVATKLQENFSATIGRNALLTSESFGQIQAMVEVTQSDVTTVTKSFADAGMSILQAGDEMYKVVSASRAIGVDTKKVSDMVLSNLSKTSQFNFQGGVEGMAKMAAQAVNLRIDMSDTLNIANNLFDPERAIDMAAAMQRLGVAQSDLLDPLRLMDMAQNDPAELQNQIAEMSKEFVRLNEKGQFEIMPGAKRQLKEIGEQLGLRNGELVKMALAGAELEDKLNKIKLPDTFSEEQKQFIANMATMGPGGEYKLKVDGTDVGLNEALDLFTKDKDKLDRFMEAQKPKTMEELAKEQISIFTRMERHLESVSKIGIRAGSAVAATKTSEDLAKGALELTSKIPKIFGEGQLSAETMRKKTQGGLGEVMTSLTEGDISGAVKNIVGNTGEYFEGVLNDVISKGEQAIKDISNSKNEGIMAIKGVLGYETQKNLESKEKEIVQTNKELTGATVKPSSTESKKELIESTTKSEYGTSSIKNELTYNGKIDVNVNLPTGLTDTEFKNLITKLVTDNEFRERLKLELLNIKGTESPTDINKKLIKENQ